MLEVRFTVVMYSDTEDPDEAVQDARDFIESCREGWYSSIKIVSAIEVVGNEEE